MYLLDTDHITLLQRGGAGVRALRARLANVPADALRVSVISYEEQVRGRLSEIARTKDISQQRERYARLADTLGMYCRTVVLPFDDLAIAEFQRLWLQRLRVGTMDLKIAAIAIANGATLLTRNMADFRKIPGLQCEDWSV